MLYPLRTATRLTLHALDGPIGQVDDVWVDDRLWTVRYLRVDARIWLGRPVLVSPISIRAVDRTNRRVHLRLTAQQLRASPEVPPFEAFTLDDERAYLAYFRYSPYWVGERLWGVADLPRALAAPPRAAHRPDPPPQPRVGRLCSLRRLQGGTAHAEDGPVGQFDDLLVAEDSWRTRYFSITPQRGNGDHVLLVPFDCVRGWDSTTRRLEIARTTAHVIQGPRLAREEPLDDARERLIQRHYGRPASNETSSLPRSVHL